MGLSTTLSPAVLDALRAATLSDDGLTLTLHGQLDTDTYRRVKKALDTYGGKWNRKAGTHDFAKNFRPHLEHLLAGGKVGADNGGKNPLAFFPTPEPVIAEMCKRIWPWPQGSRFLEPSAGEGDIANFLFNRHDTCADCVELDEDRAQTIRAKGFKVVGSDFLQFTPEQPYDYVLMNPPFTVDGDTQAYISHIEHALACLRPGGDLVAVVPGSFQWLSRKRVAEFRAFCEENAQSPLQEIAPGAFKASGTDIATCLIHITKPEEAQMPGTTQIDHSDMTAMMAETRAKMMEKAQSRKRSVKTDVLPRENQDAETPAATGWWRKGGPAHWIQDGKPLCGREMPYDFHVTSADPNDPNYQTNQCRKCRAALEKRGDEAFAAALAQSFRVRVRATGVEGTVPSGQVNPKGTVSVRYDTYRYGDRSEVEFQPAELEVLPALTIGDRVFFATQPNRRAATIVGDYSAERLPLSVKLEYDDGEKGGGHVGNLLRFIDDVPQQEPVEEASSEEAAPEPAPAPAELPGTPVLLPGLQLVPWSSIRPSRLNPRKHFDPDALKELAASIYAKGLQQNLVVRPHPTEAGAYEIAAGERRYRAIGLLVDGLNLGTEDTPKWAELPTDHPVPVLVRHMTDLELLETATAENVQRRRMTPLEEADAFAAIAAQGATPAEIARKFGYAERTVTRRIQIAQNLSDVVREAFDKGEVTLEKAEILALAPKKQQKALLDSVRYYGGASELRSAISKQAFQVANALFDTSLYSGEIVEDLFGDVPAYFQDAKQAAELQTQHLEGLAKEAEAGGAAFGEVVVHGGAYFSGNFEFPMQEGATGQVWVMDTRTGKVEHLTGRVRRTDRLSAKPVEERAEYGWQNRNLAKKLKDEAVITALYANPRLAQVAFVASQLVGYGDFGVECPSPEMAAACEHAAELSGGVLARPDSPEDGLLVVGSLPLTEEERAEVEAAAEGEEVDWEEVATDPYPEDAVLGALLDLPDEVLGQLVLIGLLESACRTELMDTLAHRTGASIAGKVRITKELLAPMNRPALIEMAVEAGFEVETVRGQGDDEIKASLLEATNDLRRRGFVPSFMDFKRPEQEVQS